MFSQLTLTSITSQVPRLLTTIQPLAILRAESRCVPVQNNTVFTQLVTSNKPGISRLDRDQAEQIDHQKDSLKTSRAEPEHNQDEHARPGEPREDQAEQTGSTSKSAKPENTLCSDQDLHTWPHLDDERAEPLQQPGPDHSSSSSTPPQTLQPLAILRAVPRCVSVEFENAFDLL